MLAVSEPSAPSSNSRHGVSVTGGHLDGSVEYGGGGVDGDLSAGRERQVVGDGGVGYVSQRRLAVDVDVDVGRVGGEVGYSDLRLSGRLREGRGGEREAVTVDRPRIVTRRILLKADLLGVRCSWVCAVSTVETFLSLASHVLRASGLTPSW